MGYMVRQQWEPLDSCRLGHKRDNLLFGSLESSYLLLPTVWRLFNLIVSDLMTMTKQSLLGQLLPQTHK